MKVIEIENLVKSYGSLTAVDNVSFSIEEGEIYGLLGPNGAGKSTLISIIASLLKPDEGKVLVLGADARKNCKNIKRELGIVPQSIALYKEFTSYENVKLFGELYGLRGKELREKIDYALEFVSLEDVKNKLAKTYSGGMLRRLNIACAIVHDPKIIIMDEPTVGIDPQSRNHILNAVKELNKKGTTIIYTTHYMEEAESLCTKIGIMDKGRIIVEGTKEELKEMVNHKHTLTIKVDNPLKIDLEKIRKIKGVINTVVKENELTINIVKEVNNLDEILRQVNESSARILNLNFEEITLETVFLSLTGRRLRD